MNCPKCQTAETRILTTGGSGQIVTRTRRCEVPACLATWVTLESVVHGSVTGKYIAVNTGTPPVHTGKHSPPDPPLSLFSGSDPDLAASEISGDRGSDGPVPPGFVAFWVKFPKKVGKAAALRAWRRRRPPLAKVLATLAWQAASHAWTKEGGKFVPNPATWINEGRWDDEPPTSTNGTAPSAYQKIEAD